MGSKNIDLDQQLLTGNHANYVSSLALFDSPVHDFLTKFNCTARDFVRMHIKQLRSSAPGECAVVGHPTLL